MKKYNVRIYLHTFVDMQIEAENETEAAEIAEATEYDMDQLLDNLVPAEDDPDITEL